MSTPTRIERHSMSRRTRETLWFYAFISPWLIGFVVLTFLPLLSGLFFSFTNFNGLNFDSLRFIGLHNYERALFNDSNVWFSIQRTAIFLVLSVPIKLVFSFSIALLLTQGVYFRGIIRTLFYLPAMIPIVAVAWIWKLLMDQNFGLVNGLLSLVWPGTAVGWLTQYPIIVLVLLSVWIGTGGAMVVFIAGLQNIPKSLEEAAKIDGANLLQMYRYVTMPLLTPVIFYQLVLSIIFALQVFVEPMLISYSTGTGGGSLSQLPPRDNYLFMVHIYSQIFVHRRYGYGSALLWILFVIIFALTFIVFKTNKYWVHYEVAQE